MKKETITFVLALVVMIAGVAFYTAAPLHVGEYDEPSLLPSGKVCYLQHITTPAGDDNTYLDVTFGESRSVRGRFNLLPAEKDRLIGPYAGTWTESEDGIILNVTHAYAAEGTIGEEGRIFHLRETGAGVSFDNGQTFPIVLPQVDCAEISADVADPL